MYGSLWVLPFVGVRGEVVGAVRLTSFEEDAFAGVEPHFIIINVLFITLTCNFLPGMVR